MFTKYFKSGAIDQDLLLKSDLFALVALLKLVMQKNDYIKLIDDIDGLFNKYQTNFKSIRFEDIIFLSGFRTDWKKDIEESL